MASTMVKVTDKWGIVNTWHQIGDRYYPNFAAHVGADYSRHLDLIRNLDIRTDDVMMCGFPKSGNHWMYEIISMVIRQTTNYDAILFEENLMDLISTDQVKALADRPSPRILSSHLNVDEIPKQVVEKKAKIIYLVRNLKDVSASLFDFLTTLEKYGTYPGTFENYLDQAMTDECFFGGWFNHLRNAEKLMQDRPDLPVHTIYYERMKQNPIEEISALCKFLGKPETLATAIAEMTSFQTMKDKYMAEKQGDWQKETMSKGGSLLKRGTFGRWKTHFTVAQSEWVDSLIDEKLGDSKIGAMLKPFM